MAISVPAVVRPREVPEGDRVGTLPLVGAAPRRGDWVDAPDSARWVLEVASRAIDATLSIKEACLTLGMDKSLLRRQLSGDGHLSLFRMGALPDEFWIEFAHGVLDARGVVDKHAKLTRGQQLINQGLALVAEATR